MDVHITVRKLVQILHNLAQCPVMLDRHQSSPIEYVYIVVHAHSSTRGVSLCYLVTCLIYISSDTASDRHRADV